MNLTGNWIFKEEFETGVNSGFARLSQEGHKIIGTFELTETLKGRAPIHVVQQVEGIVMAGKIIIKGTRIEVTNGGDDSTEYSPDTWEGTLNSSGDIIGSSIDQEGICGVFTMIKHK